MLNFVLLIALCGLHTFEAAEEIDSGGGIPSNDIQENPVHGVIEGRLNGLWNGQFNGNFHNGLLARCNLQDTNPTNNLQDFTKFLLLFPKNFRDLGQSQHLFIMAIDSDGTCKITTPVYTTPETVNVYSNDSTNYVFSSKMIYSAAGYSNKGIYVECDVPVLIEGFNYLEKSSGVFTVLPLCALGQQYIMPSYDAKNRDVNSLFGITTLTNNTSVTVYVRTTRGRPLVFDGSSYLNGRTFDINLSALETAQVLCPGCDLSGTYITSSAPIAVVSGNDCAILLSSTCSHTNEMVVPIEASTNVFAIPYFPIAWFRGLVRIYLYQDTSVSIIYSTNTTTYSLQFTDFVEIPYDETIFIESNAPVMVQLYGQAFSSEFGFIGANAFMMTIPGIDQYKSKYAFTVIPDSTYNHSLSFVVKSEDKNGIRLDGAEVDMSDETVSSLHGTSYSSFVVSVLSGYHVAEHITGECFGLFVVGIYNSDGYGFAPL